MCFYFCLKMINTKLFFISNSSPPFPATCKALCRLSLVRTQSLYLGTARRVPRMHCCPHVTWACRTVSCSFSTLACSFHSAAWFSNCEKREHMQRLFKMSLKWPFDCNLCIQLNNLLINPLNEIFWELCEESKKAKEVASLKVGFSTKNWWSLWKKKTNKNHLLFKHESHKI